MPDIDLRAVAANLTKTAAASGVIDRPRYNPGWSPNEGQSRAIRLAVQWWNEKARKPLRSSSVISMGDESFNREKLFYLSGWAGTGKTSIVPFIIDEVGVSPHKVAYATYTGKAAQVLSKKTKRAVSTIHSLIYRMVKDPVTGKQTVVLKNDSILREFSLLVLDEVSMISRKMMMDLMSFGVPIICLGDPFQLPPIGGDAFFTDDFQPDVLLVEITRTAKDNPIIWFSTRIRTGQGITAGFFGSQETGFVFVHPKTQIQEEAFTIADQILCGYNRTRCEWNLWYRKKMGIIEDARDYLPHKGDKLICLKNNYSLGVVNGSQLTAQSESRSISELWFNLSMTEYGVDIPADYLEAAMNVQMVEDSDDYYSVPREDRDHLNSLLLKYRQEDEQLASMGLDVKYPNLGSQLILANQKCYTGWLYNPKVPDHLVVDWSTLKDVVELDYGGVLSVHKAQGSEWPKVVVLNEPPLREQDLNRRWQYTSATRASHSLVFAI